MLTALLVIAILVLLIIVHEFGHFLAAKIFGVSVEEFGVGYPPRAFTFGKIGDTVYTLNWIPFGGFVRLFGDEGEQEHGRGSLVDSPRWKQAVILVAGVAMNAVGAWALFAVAFHIGVPTAVDSVPAGQHAQLMVTDVVAGSPAAAAGLKAGDEITGVADANGARIIDTVTPDTVVAFVNARGGQPVTLSYIHDGSPSTATVIPANAIIPGAAGRPALGIALSLVTLRSEPWGQAATDAFYQTGNALVMVGGNLWYLLSSALHGAPDLSGIVGPVGIVSYVGQASQNGIGEVLILAGIISANLVIINLIPIPALDGGRLLVLIIEGALRRSAPRLAIQMLNSVGVSLIILLMVVVTYHDIARLLT
jgi:regulator of sigma E protease